MALVAGTKIIKPAGEKMDKLEEAVSQVRRASYPLCVCVCVRVSRVC